jgi:predicted GIY-YIG superfamily endonuclease
VRDRLIEALRSCGGVADPASLLVRAGVVAELPPPPVAAQLVRTALAGDVRVALEPGLVRFVHLHPAPVFAVLAVVSRPRPRPWPVSAEHGHDDFFDDVPQAVSVEYGHDDFFEADSGAATAAAAVRARARDRAPRARDPDRGHGDEIAGVKVVGPAADELADVFDPGGLAPAEVAPALQAWLDGAVLVGHPLGALARRLLDLGLALPPERLCTRALGRRLVPGLRSSRLEALCGALEIDYPGDARARARDAARAIAHALVELRRRAGVPPADLCELSRRAPAGSSARAPAAADPATQARLDEVLARAPAAPGVYRLLDAEGETIYVGASEDLRRRLGEHFGAGAAAHSRRLVAAAFDASFEPSASALEAFLREAELIAALRPRLNQRAAALGRAVYLRVVRARRGTAGAAAPPRLVAAPRPPKRSRAFGPFVFPGGARAALAALANAFAGAEERLEAFLASGDLALAPRRGPEVVRVAQARAAVRGSWEAGTRAVLLPGGAILLLYGAAEHDLVRTPTPEKVAARLADRAWRATAVSPSTAAVTPETLVTPAAPPPPPDHVPADRAALAVLVQRYAAGLPAARLDLLPDLDAVRRAVAALIAPD